PAAFTLPIIERLVGGPRRTRVLNLTPTRELCVQVEGSFRKYAKHAPISVVSVYGGVPLEPQENALRRGVDVVVATPGRLIDHLERQNIVFDDLEVLVLDEADRMLDMGFAPQISRVVSDIPPYRQTVLFSAAMHANKTQAQRTRALDDFKSGRVRVLVATDIAQRGLDISGITHVINYDVPQQAEDYVHRIGRTGRAANDGDAFTFMSPDEIAMVRTIERVIGQEIPRISVPGFDFGTVAAD